MTTDREELYIKLLREQLTQIRELEGENEKLKVKYKLTKVEEALLNKLIEMKNNSRYVPYEFLIYSVIGLSKVTDGNLGLLNKHIYNIRQKRPDLKIINIRSLGYKLIPK